MSKCDIAIDYYRPDREFRTGQTVQGWVRITVNKNIKCRSLHLNVFWKTHGCGNTSRTNYSQQNLFQGEWQVGEAYEYAFEFTPPISPQTYHGHYLNIDHYVSVRADIPWAIDTRCEEEFMWRMGSQAEDRIEEAPVLDNRSSCLMVFGSVFAAGLGTAAMVLTRVMNSFLFLLLLIPALLIAFFTLRSRLAEKKLGEVKWGTLGSCYAGDEIPSLLQIGPVGNVKIRDITATVHGHESVVSGSGTDATTYTHDLHNEVIVLATSPQIERGGQLELQPNIRFPMTEANSIELPDNKIRWTVTLAIRMDMWPDWVQQREVILLGSLQSGVGGNPNPAFDVLSLHELIEVARNLSQCGKDQQKIKDSIAKNADKLYTVSVEIRQVSPAGSGFDDPDYENGRTVAGNLSGSNILVSLQLPSRYNSEVDSLVRGSTWTASGAVIRWDVFQQTLVVLGI